MSYEVAISEVKKGDFFTLSRNDNPKENQVWIRGAYDRSTKKYSAYRFDDVNRERFFPAARGVFVGFTF